MPCARAGSQQKKRDFRHCPAENRNGKLNQSEVTFMFAQVDKTLARPELVYRLAGLICCIVTGLDAISTHWYVGPSLEMAGLIEVLLRRAGVTGPARWMLIVDLLCYGIFGWAFWRAMDSERLPAAEKHSVKLLGLQLLLGLLVTPALFFIVVSEACFLLKPRRACALFWALVVTGVLLTLAMPVDAEASRAAAALSGANQTPLPIVLLIRCLLLPMMLLLSYCLGLLGATEWRNTHLLNGDLVRISAARRTASPVEMVPELDPLTNTLRLPCLIKSPPVPPVMAILSCA
jgi:hypothetical protein